MIGIIQKELQEAICVKKAALALSEEVEKAANILIQSLSHGGTIFFCGNGGSAADAQHLAAELVGRFERNRRALPAMALTVDTSIMTAVANDFGYEEIFVRQLEGLAEPGDVLVGISTSGRSSNVVRAMKWGRENNLETIGMTGEKGGDMVPFSSVLLAAPSPHTPRIQELHITWGHILCKLVEEALFPHEP